MTRSEKAVVDGTSCGECRKRVLVFENVEIAGELDSPDEGEGPIFSSSGIRCQ